MKSQNDLTKTDQNWLTPGRFCLFLSICTLALFWDVVFGDRTFIFRDYGLYSYPLAHYYKECFWRGELPLWNPLSNMGVPFLAQWNTLVLYPPSLFYLLLPLPWSLSTFCLLHLVLGGMGMFFLARHWTGNRLAAAIAGTAYAFNGLTLNCLMWPCIIAALGWMPWVVWLTQRAWREGGRVIVLAALVGAMQMLTGAAEALLFTWGILGVLWLGDLFSRSVPVRLGASRFLGVGVLVAALASVQLLPFLDLLAHSQRDGSGTPEQWPMPVWGAANLLVPLFRCHESLAGVYLQQDQTWTSSYYAGIGIAALSLLTLWKAGSLRAWLLGGISALGLVLAMGEEGLLLDWARKVCPVLGLIRYPVKFVIPLTLILPILAALSVSELLRRQDAGQGRWRRAALGIGIFCCLTIGAILWFSHAYPLPQERWPDTLASGLSRVAWLLAFLAALFILHRLRSGWAQLLTGLGILLLVWGDLVTHASLQNPTAASSIYSLKLPSLDELTPRPEPGVSRAMLSLSSLLHNHHAILSKPEDGFICNRLELAFNCNLLDNLPKVDGFYPLHLRLERDIHFNLFLATNVVRAQLADFVGVSQMTNPEKAFEWQARSTFLPQVTAGQAAICLESSNILTAMLAPDFQPDRTVYLPIEAKARIRATNHVQAQIRAQQFASHRITFDVECTQPAMVVIAQMFYHPWKAYVDGQPVQLWRANHAFQALEVPGGGRHRVELVYRDAKFYAGASISGLALLGCLLALKTSQRRTGLSPYFGSA